MTDHPNVLLVHGAWADASSWAPVIELLHRDGFGTVVASQLSLRTFADDVATVARDLDLLAGPTIVAGHSYGGAVISQAAAGRADVTGLVYVAAYAPKAGQSAFAINQEFGAASQGAADLVNIGADDAPDLVLDRARFHADFCADLPATQAAVLAAVQKPTSVLSLAGAGDAVPAWETLRANTWYQISAEDKMIQPELQRQLAAQVADDERIVTLPAAHASMLSRPAEIAGLIEKAAHNS
ncbi:Alpha/beta hydrolase family [Nocardia otitidiscaviarum]|uniref:Alpha/beta hydrolase family n=1 Tax=Nocardia otitidiscaviarum TaxID=1823 RepID=A0A378YSB6_9NOCA|nr:alpha/beta hydrolase [Nocardia otitidiscaviarum]SUA79708.1 Alpha/beta hydrolase family [Nocardia otitidiscaviarum]